MEIAKRKKKKEKDDDRVKIDCAERKK